MVNRTQAAVCSICCFIVFIISISLFAASWSILGPLEYGLDKNDVTKAIDLDKVYTGGRYFLGLGHSFVKWPAQLDIIDFSPDPEAGGGPLSVGSSDGQTIRLEITIYYRLMQAEIAALYRLYGSEYQDAFIRIAQSEVKNVAIEFSTLEYFTKRLDIANKMLNAVAAAFDKVHCTVELLLLRGIGLPSGIEAELVGRMKAQQEKRTATFQQQIDFVLAQTEVVGALADGNITRLQGAAEAGAALYREEGRAEATSLVVAVEESAYEELRDALSLSNEELLKYLFLTRKVRTARARDTLLFGVPGNAAGPILSFAAKSSSVENTSEPPASE